MPIKIYSMIETMLLVNGGDYCDSYQHIPCGEEVPTLLQMVLLSGGFSKLLWKVSGGDTVAMSKKVALIGVPDWKKQGADNLSLSADWVMLADEELSFHRSLTTLGKIP
jgi:hypothetical protein